MRGNSSRRRHGRRPKYQIVALCALPTESVELLAVLSGLAMANELLRGAQRMRTPGYSGTRTILTRLPPLATPRAFELSAPQLDTIEIESNRAFNGTMLAF